jgi:hypothetical protein
MRGSPPLQLALILIGFMMMSVPLIRLTSGRVVAKATVVKATEQGAAVPTQVRLRWAHRPHLLSVTLDGKPLLEALDLSLPMIESEAALSLPKEGIEISVQAEWPEGTPETALSLELEPDERDTQSQTRWSRNGKMQEVISFQWK